MLKTASWPLDKLVPYARNPRDNDAQIARMAAAIREFGFRIPIVVRSDGTVVDGHLRLKAARQLGLAEVPVVLADELSDAQVKAFRLLANRSATWAAWDEGLLTLELEELQAMAYDVGHTGFDAAEIDALLAEPASKGWTDPDAVPEPPAEPITKRGDVWVLGRHRLMCGDSTQADDVQHLLGAARPHLMVTDPPYGVAYDPAWRNRALAGKKTRRTGRVANDDRADWREAWALFPGDVAYVWHGALHAATVAESLAACGFEIRAQIIWAKERPVLSRGHYHWMHEPCWYAVKGKAHWRGGRKQVTVWRIPSKDQDAATTHGAQKPVQCMQRPIENHLSPGQVVYEPFAGSGTTLIAAEITGRACRAMELEPAYVDVALGRWEAFTGQKAEAA